MYKLIDVKPESQTPSISQRFKKLGYEITPQAESFLNQLEKACITSEVKRVNACLTLDEYRVKLACCGVKGIYYRYGAYKVCFPISCHDRFCKRCARRRASKARKLLRVVAKEVNLQPNRLKHITLTVQNFPEDKLEWGLDMFHKWIRRLKERVFWKKRVKAWFQGFESKLDDCGNYHLHVHILAESDYMDERELSKVWSDIVGQEWRGFIVKVNAVDDTERAFYEVAKYPFKPSELPLRSRWILSNLYKKRRLYAFGGAWYNLFKGVHFEDLLDKNEFYEEVKKYGVFMGFLCILDLERTEGWRYDYELGAWILSESRRE